MDDETIAQRGAGTPRPVLRRIGPDDDRQMREWLIEKILPLERAYLAHEEPWRQSGFSGTREGWDACRRPVAECLHRGGAFLDIGCANGYLLESVIGWKRAEGMAIEPFGLEAGHKLADRARRRLPQFADNIRSGNAWDWAPPRRYDFVRTELAYVPPVLRKRYLGRLIDEFLAPGGSLLVAEYRSRNQPYRVPWCDVALRRWGFVVTLVRSGLWEGRELTRVAVVEKGDGGIAIAAESANHFSEGASRKTILPISSP